MASAATWVAATSDLGRVSLPIAVVSSPVTWVVEIGMVSASRFGGQRIELGRGQALRLEVVSAPNCTAEKLFSAVVVRGDAPHVSAPAGWVGLDLGRGQRADLLVANAATGGAASRPGSGQVAIAVVSSPVTRVVGFGMVSASRFGVSALSSVVVRLGPGQWSAPSCAAENCSAPWSSGCRAALR